MSKRVTRGWLVRAGIATAVGAAAIFAAVTMGAFGSTNTSAAGLMSQTVVGGGAQPVGGSFNVDISVANPGNATWGGYSMQLAYNPAVVSVNSTVSDNVGPGCTGGSWANPQNSPTVQTGCFGQVSTGAGNSDTINFTCIAPGSTGLHLITLAEDPVNGSTFFDPSAANIPTDLIDGAVTCTLPITKSNNAPGSGAIAGGTVQYTVHVGNPTATSSPGHTISDTVPAPLTGVAVVSSTNGVLDGCSAAANVVTCSSAIVQPNPTGFDLVISANIPLSAAGQNGICNTAKLDGLADSSPSCFNVAPASLTVTKVADAASYSTGSPMTWTITVNSNGPSPAAGVVVTDTAIEGFSITGQANGTGSCTTNGFTASNASFTCGDMASGATSTFTVTGTTNASAPNDQTCDNGVVATSTNGASTPANYDVQVACKPPFTHVQFVKSTDADPFTNDNPSNLWLCKGSNCTQNGEGFLDINEIIIPITQTGSDPQGVGAFEMQIKYDNHIFDISVTPTNWLYSTGRVPGDTGIGGCSATIITENDIRFGCVSKNPQPLAPQTGCLGPDNVTMVTTAICGTNDAGIAAVIHVTPKADLPNRLTPGNDNGAIRTLLDEGCEVADIWGHPLSAANGPFLGIAGNGYDALGREVPLTGIAPGGQVTDCGDMTITVRILEGDMNLDCVVDVADDQTEASHYGAFFGALLYQPWYDLEPALKDGDVDIKDLQKVFGRNGSTCANPVPPQPALPEPVDP